eukprot:c20880_g1_i2.p1 GENE.c20880_g1_i2~~c20880_g1_i2.p1  ORF type:complete len:262 (+),score=28.78 c20880_g1_i2:1-786(+)
MGAKTKMTTITAQTKVQDLFSPGAPFESFNELNGLFNKYITLKDILETDFDQLVELTPPQFKIQMHYFLHSALPDIRALLLQSQQFSKNEIMDLSGKVLSKELLSFGQNGKLFLPQLLNIIKEKNLSSSVKYLKLSWNSLFDSDLDDILAICRLLTNLEILDIAGNRLYGQSKDFDDKLLEILNIDSIKFVDISANVIGGIEKKDFYVNLEPKYFRKLIWVPNGNWLIVGGWKNLVDDRTDFVTIEKIVFDVHQEYFKRKI